MSTRSRFLQIVLLPVLSLPALLGQELLAQKAPGEIPQGGIQSRIQQVQSGIRSTLAELVEARASGLRSIHVNGVELSPEHVRREAIFLVGAQIVKAKIADFFVEEWKQRQLEQGRKPEEFEISEAKIVEELKGTVDEFKKKNPGVEFWEAVRALTGLEKEGYIEQRRKTERFNKVFFPGTAKDWPMITREAIMASAQGSDGKEFWENIEKTSVDAKGKPQKLPAFWMQLCRQWVQKQLEKWSDIRFPSDGLAPNVVMSVNGREWKTGEAFTQVKAGLFQQDFQKAMLEVVIREALHQALVKQGAYLSAADFRAQFDEYRQEYDSTPFTTEVIATAFKGYPSLEAFRQRWRLMRSFENMIAKEINDETLAAHGKKFQRFFSDGQTSVDMIQFMARSVKSGVWLPDGMEQAKKRCEKAYEAIKSGTSFDDVMASSGEFYSSDEEKGKLPAKSLNQLRQNFHENEFTDLLLGYSLGTYLFYDAPEGKVVGPLRGMEGWFLARVNSRTPAHAAVDVKDQRTRELVKQDYVAYRFMQWANDVLAKAVIE